MIAAKTPPSRVRKPLGRSGKAADMGTPLDTIVQVHKPTIRDISTDRETQRTTTTESSETSSACSNRTFILDERSTMEMGMLSQQTPSVDEEPQINSKILSLIETEMKRDLHKPTPTIKSHFSDSRPQSLSFYEEEKLPEELSGNLELLSPEERRHYKRRKEHLSALIMDSEERNMYNTLGDVEDLTLRKSKSRKKKHETELGDSREMMIPKEKRKTKRKKHHDTSPMSRNGDRRKHRKDHQYNEQKSDIAIALEDLQDDVFEGTPSGTVNAIASLASTAAAATGAVSSGVSTITEQAAELCAKHQDANNGINSKARKSPRRSDKVYVQKKHRPDPLMPNSYGECPVCRGPVRSAIKGFSHRPSRGPLPNAILLQSIWRRLCRLVHGLLGGLAISHLAGLPMYGTSVDAYNSTETLTSIYAPVFYVLCTLCIISVFDKFDTSHLDAHHWRDLIANRKSCILIVFYISAMIAHIAISDMDFLQQVEKDDEQSRIDYIDKNCKRWYICSMVRAGVVFLGWMIYALVNEDDLLLIHLKNMMKYYS